MIDTLMRLALTFRELFPTEELGFLPFFWGNFVVQQEGILSAFFITAEDYL